ncbi:C2H2 type zinc-finger-domain-containing protein [Pisolithus croceorrhizus]|nr:C2H2 type zinc-finger-domain-containing protein [Pisolithus croceorrhizus]
MGSEETALFTCLSCTVAFVSAEDQRMHYRSDYHRYNMKRRVSGLPPVSAAVFDQKVLEQRVGPSVTATARSVSCAICRKSYATENAYRSHLTSKKHKDNELKGESRDRKTHDMPITSIPPKSLEPGERSPSEQLERNMDDEIAEARSKISTDACLFCSIVSAGVADNLIHMASVHSFFIPDAEYLVDLPGLLTYLGEKVVIGNVCIYCNGRGRDLHTLEAVRKHMLDKSHCKIAYDTEDDRLEISDFYDFTTSYPNDGAQNVDDADEWEELEDDVDVDEVVNEDTASGDPGNPGRVTYGDTEYELVLPSGARIGHRSMKRYYDQSFYGIRPKEQDSTSGAALVRRLLKDKNSALVPRKGAFGAFGAGTDVVKARNKGEAREAGRHVREFRDQRRKEEFRTKVGLIQNHQKHYRDPLLQVRDHQSPSVSSLIIAMKVTYFYFIPNV